MRRYGIDSEDVNVLYRLLETRSPSERTGVAETVRGIVETVRQSGDAALRQYTQDFDKVSVSGIEVPASVLDAALAALPAELRATMERSAANIRKFHERQRTNSWFDATADGSILGQKVTPLERVGVYAPAGSAPLPSTVLMDVIPARVAGVGAEAGAGGGSSGGICRRASGKGPQPSAKAWFDLDKGWCSMPNGVGRSRGPDLWSGATGA